MISVERNADLQLTLKGLDESLLMDLQDGARKRIAEYELSIAKHDPCEARMCLLYKGEPVMGRSCSEDLMFLHGQISLLHQFLFETEQYV